MAVGVVDVLEVVDVDERNGNRAAVPTGPLDLGPESRDEALAVRDTGQLVDGRPIVGLGHRNGDRVDRRPQTALEPAARHVDLHVQLAGRDPLRRLHEPPDPDLEEDERQDRHARCARAESRQEWRCGERVGEECEQLSGLDESESNEQDEAGTGSATEQG